MALHTTARRDMSPQEEINREQDKLQMASYAQQVVNNPAYKNAMLLIRGALIDEFNSTSYKDVGDLQECKRRLDTVENFQKILESTMRSGVIAQERISKLTNLLTKIGIK
jgi:hypothetical protein